MKMFEDFEEPKDQHAILKAPEEKEFENNYECNDTFLENLLSSKEEPTDTQSDVSSNKFMNQSDYISITSEPWNESQCMPAPSCGNPQPPSSKPTGKKKQKNPKFYIATILIRIVAIDSKVVFPEPEERKTTRSGKERKAYGNDILKYDLSDQLLKLLLQDSVAYEMLKELQQTPNIPDKYLEDRRKKKSETDKKEKLIKYEETDKMAGLNHIFYKIKKFLSKVSDDGKVVLRKKNKPERKKEDEEKDEYFFYPPGASAEDFGVKISKQLSKRPPKLN
jgi:hypothetical protein